MTRRLTLADSRRTQRYWWWSSWPSGSGWWVHSPNRACTSAGCGPLWIDCYGRARTGHLLHNQSHIPGGINRKNTLSEVGLDGLVEMHRWRKERAWMWTIGGLGIKDWCWVLGSEANNSLLLLRVHLTLSIISLTPSIWMNRLPLEDPRKAMHLNDKVSRGHPLLHYWRFTAAFLSYSHSKRMQWASRWLRGQQEKETLQEKGTDCGGGDGENSMNTI